MVKIGRNDPCPCGSGKKFKKCCISKTANTGQLAVPTPNTQPSLKNEIEKIQADAAIKKSLVRTLGVFIFLSTASGDAWLFEITEMDAVQVAAGGKKIDVTIEEGPETIEINWTHKFAVKNKILTFTSYQDGSVMTPDGYPTHSIHSSVRKIRERIPPEILNSIHIPEESAATADPQQ